MLITGLTPFTLIARHGTVLDHPYVIYCHNLERMLQHFLFLFPKYRIIILVAFFWLYAPISKPATQSGAFHQHNAVKVLCNPLSQSFFVTILLYLFKNLICLFQYDVPCKLLRAFILTLKGLWSGVLLLLYATILNPNVDVLHV